MAETFCGKSCTDCPEKEELSCPGCRTGPGRELGGACDLARCVREKGHETCFTCLNQTHCGTFQSRSRMPEYRKKKLEAQRYLEQARAARAPILGKWLWLLFWLVVPGTLASLISLEFFREAAPGLYLFGKLLNAACTLAYGLILLKLSTVDEGYRTAGLCGLIPAAVNGAIMLLTGGEAPGWTLIFSLPAAVAAVYGDYREYMTHSAVLRGIDNALADNWESLWKWFLGTYIAIFGGIFFIAVIPILGLLVALGGAVSLIVVGITQLVYLYRTAKLFREYPTPVYQNAL